ncbi:MAG: DUF86 domain-containing protein [Nanoarchaeota archaeon]
MRIEDKIEQINIFLKELEKIKPYSFEQYDLKTSAACERYFEKIVEAIVDLGYLVIKHCSINAPEDDRQVFDILVKKNIISTELANRLKEAKGMRNILSHQYGNVDNKVVFNAITKELPKEVAKFIYSINKNLIK